MKPTYYPDHPLYGHADAMLKELEQWRPGVIVSDRTALLGEIIALLESFAATKAPRDVRAMAMAVLLGPHLSALQKATSLIERIRREGPRYPRYVLEAAWAIMEAHNGAKGLLPPADARTNTEM